MFTPFRTGLLSCAVILILLPGSVCAVGQAPPPSPEQAASEADRQRMMDLLHITSLRRGVDNDPKSEHAANYDESKANPFPKLPDPLVLKNGEKVTTAQMWWKQRRPEIVEDFDREVYGRMPAHTPKVRWVVSSRAKDKVGDFAVITKQLVGHVDNSSYPKATVSIDLTLTTPANAKGPVPVIMQFVFDPAFLAALRKKYPNFTMPKETGPDWKEQALAKGWGYAELVPTSYQADNGAGLTEGIIGLVNKGQPRSPDDWGTLRAWGWGASRALDYFETDKAVNAKAVAISGHSRYGKAALVTMADDQRFAVAYISSSGEGGAKLNRRNWGEVVENVAAWNEYHWMAGNFLKYSGPLHWDDLPVDSHELIALCAPRPVFIGAGADPISADGWADARGMFMAEVAAGPVYQLLGNNGLATDQYPPIETAMVDGDLGFRQHSGGHTPGPNWATFYTFAGRYF